MSHKVVIQFDSIKNVHKNDRATWVAAVWKMMEASGMEGVQELHDSSEIKGFVWSVEEKKQGQFLMEFSSIRQELVNAVLKGAQKSIQAGTAWNLAGDTILRPTEAFAIEDFRVHDGKIRLAPVSGVIANRAVKKNGKVHHEGICPFDNQIEFVKNIKRNLIEKTKRFVGIEIKEDEFNLRVISSGRPVQMPFKGLPLVGHMCSIQINGPKPIIETALYAGLGRMNGLGFGMMTPMREATA